MAPAMRLWLGLALGGAAVISVSALPPAMTRLRGLPQRLPEEVRAAALQRKASDAANLLRRLRWLDSLPALAVGTAQDGLAVAGDPALASGEELEQVRRMLRGELARVPRGEEPVVVGFFVQRPDFASEVDRFVMPRRRYEFYAGRESGTPYCLIVDVRAERFTASTLGMWTDADGSHHSDVLQVCRFVAAYGPPGRGIGDWLARGGFRYLELAVPPGTETYVAPAPPSRSFFGRRISYWEPRDIGPQKCLSGEAAACADLVARGAPVDELVFTPVDAHQDIPAQIGATYVPSPPPALTGAARYLFADLEREYGTDTFRAFWTSGRDMPDAFQASFGVSLGDWTVRWAAEQVGLERNGPALPRGVWLDTVVLVILSALAGGAWQRRRAVA